MADQTLAETAVRLLVSRRKSGALVTPACVDQNAAGPKHYCHVAGYAGEAQAFIQQIQTHSQPARTRLDLGQTQLRSGLVVPDDEYETNNLTAVFSNPAAVRRQIERADILGDDLRNQGLELRVPAMLVLTRHAMPMNDPAWIVGGAVAEERPDLPHRFYQMRLGGLWQLFQRG